LHLMGVIAISRQQHDHAVQCIVGALQQTQKPEYLRSLGNALQHLGRLDDALKAYDKALTLKPDDADIWTSMGFVLTKLERDDEAITVFQHVLKLNPRHKGATRLYAKILYEAKRYDEAIPYYDRCAELEPDRAATYQCRGVCHSRNARHELAIADYEK